MDLAPNSREIGVGSAPIPARVLTAYRKMLGVVMQIARTEGRNPFEAVIMLVFVLSMIGRMIAGRFSPPVIERAMGHGASIAWQILVIMGSILVLLGLSWPQRNPALALNLERTGLTMAAFGMFAASAAVATQTPWGDSLAAPMSAGFGAAMALRIWHIHLAFRRALKAHEAGHRR